MNTVKGVVSDDDLKDLTNEELLAGWKDENVVHLSLNDQQATLNETVDSENLADLVATVVAYAAYSSLPRKYKDVKLATLDLSTERLFFINHCVKWCAEESEEQHAPSYCNGTHYHARDV
ncbi:hypothetical protein HPB51_023542 [Rhipicephalus microplus]|uniref:Peptidase M13 C-terminal domain-containing protein n=1 Tax=Rhipicephalus microplus TaxID=6941 RepID=A0A9J6F7Y7_RHIMP|nr:hypothetical protein HPB51_023542 [Rhipicephalus microplus]